MAKKKRAEQTEIPGTQRKVAPEIEKATSALVEARADKKDAKAAEDKAADQLVIAMRAAEIDTYKFTDAEGVEVTVSIDSKTKVKVRRKNPAQAEETN